MKRTSIVVFLTVVLLISVLFSACKTEQNEPAVSAAETTVVMTTTTLDDHDFSRCLSDDDRLAANPVVLYDIIREANVDESKLTNLDFQGNTCSFSLYDVTSDTVTTVYEKLQNIDYLSDASYNVEKSKKDIYGNYLEDGKEIAKGNFVFEIDISKKEELGQLRHQKIFNYNNLVNLNENIEQIFAEKEGHYAVNFATPIHLENGCWQRDVATSFACASYEEAFAFVKQISEMVNGTFIKTLSVKSNGEDSVAVSCYFSVFEYAPAQ